MLKKIFLFFVFTVCCLALLLELNHHGRQLLSLETPGRKGDLVSHRSGELIKGDIVSGTIRSKHPRLGQILVRFNNNEHDSEDVVLFRIKEEGRSDWHYQVKIKTDQFQPGALFPFGFPVIENSRGKTYYFEIESLNGEQGRGISLDSRTPLFTARSVFTKSDLLSDPKRAIYFVFSKIVSLWYFPAIVIYVFYPFVFFLFLFYFSDHGISFSLPFWSGGVTVSLLKQQISFFAVVVIIFYTVLFVRGVEDIVLISVGLTFLIYSHKYRHEPRISLFFASLLLFFSLLSLVFAQVVTANLLAIWAYTFVWIYLIQLIYSLFFRLDHPISLEKYLSDIRRTIFNKTGR